MKALTKPKLPLALRDTVIYRDRVIPIKIKIYENSVVALLAQDSDFFGQGKTIHEAKESLLRSLADEWAFLSKHVDELSGELQAKYKLLQRLLA
ncbi:MAG: hypothetical protein NZ610_04620 [Candidatus Bipolaricaulota bacterium]|nr:hypothetical protein [Candidatus Bipolaricaulota bacterium]